MYAMKFGDPNFLLSGRVGPDSKVLYYRNPAQRVEKVAPWLTLDSDVYPAVVDGRILWVVDGYTTTDHYPQAERDSFHDMTNDSLTPAAGRPHAADRPDQLHAQRGQGDRGRLHRQGHALRVGRVRPDPARPGAAPSPAPSLDKDQIPSDLLPHLRYPEDMFKVQRYQYARYHVTDPSDFYQASNQWQVPEDPVRTGSNQAPIRMFTRDPDTGQQTWSLTSNYVPNGKSNLAGFVTADSDATSPDYGKILVEQPRSENVPGPTQAYNHLISDPRITRKTQSFRLGDATTQYGNVISVPLSSGLMYVVPVYATRPQTRRPSYLTLRYVMVPYGSKVGIGDTLVDAITDMAGAAPPPAQNPAKGSQHRRARAPGEGAGAAPAGADRLRRGRQGAAAGPGRRVGPAHPPGAGRGRQGPQPAAVAAAGFEPATAHRLKWCPATRGGAVR